MTKHQHEFPHSTSIANCEYDEATKDMHITFISGGKHKFKNVDKEVFDGFKNHESPGTYFHSKVRKRYESERVD